MKPRAGKIALPAAGYPAARQSASHPGVTRATSSACKACTPPPPVPSAGSRSRRQAPSACSAPSPDQRLDRARPWPRYPPHTFHVTGTTDVKRLVKGTVLPGRWCGLGRASRSAVAQVRSELVAGAGIGTRGWWWPDGRDGTTRRSMVDRQATTLMCAGWDRRSAIRRKVPLTDIVVGVAGGHSSDGGRSCDGGAPARRDDQRTFLADPKQMGGMAGISGGHLGPQEPGQLAGDRGGDHVLGGLAGCQAAESAAQAQLRCPCAGDHLGSRPRWRSAICAPTLGRCFKDQADSTSCARR